MKIDRLKLIDPISYGRNGYPFDLSRHPNRHLGFGIGEHFCLGANLARMTSGCLFRELTSRLEHVERTGDPERTASNLVPGLKHLPSRYRLSAA